MTIGQALEKLRIESGLVNRDLEAILKVSIATLTKIKKGEKELSFLMAVRLLDHFGLSMDGFCSMLSQKELDRKELQTIKWEAKMAGRSKEG